VGYETQNEEKAAATNKDNIIDVKKDQLLSGQLVFFHCIRTILKKR
jgi:hypothetical protein